MKRIALIITLAIAAGTQINAAPTPIVRGEKIVTVDYVYPDEVREPPIIDYYYPPFARRIAYRIMRYLRGIPFFTPEP